MSDSDPILAELIAEARADAPSLGLLLHGSRARGHALAGSDYDLLRVITDDAFAERQQQAALLERRSVGGAEIEILYQSASRLRWLARHPDWYSATYATAVVLFDRTGEMAKLREQIVRRAGRRARDEVERRYDDYMNGFVRSLKAARRGDELGQRLHAAESALALVRMLFGLEATWAPYHDDLQPSLGRLEAAQGWSDGELRAAILRLVRDPDPQFQRALQVRVERLMKSRGIEHEWAETLERLLER